MKIFVIYDKAPTSEWAFFDFAELTGKNKIREWLDGLPEVDRGRIDARLLLMEGQARWSEGWVSKYVCSGTLFEFRIKGKGVQYRPLGDYYGPRRFLILAGAIEKGDKIPSSDVETALDRHKRAKRNNKHAVPHQFEGESNLEEND